MKQLEFLPPPNITTVLENGPRTELQTPTGSYLVNAIRLTKRTEEPSQPWTVTVSQSDNNTYKAQYAEGKVFSSLAFGSEISLSGLEPDTPFNISAGDALYIEQEFTASTGALTTSTVKCDDALDVGSLVLFGEDKAFEKEEATPFRHTHTRTLLAVFVEPEESGDAPVVDQRAFSNFVMVVACVSGAAVRMLRAI